MNESVNIKSIRAPIKMVFLVSIAMSSALFLSAHATVLQIFVNVPAGDANTATIEAGKIKAFGKEFDGLKVCNEDTLGNPENFEVFRSPNTKDTLIILCPGLAGGDENIVSVLRSSGQFEARKILPAAGSHRITNEVLQRTARDMLGLNSKAKK
jgi:hypothetical protein